MATRTYMQQVGSGSNRNQSFHQGPLLQAARATYQGAMNDQATGQERAGGLSTGMFAGRPAYMPSDAAARNPLMTQLDAGRASGFAQHASYGPDAHRGYAPTVNPILANFGTFNPSPLTGQKYGTEQAPAPAAPQPAAPAPPAAPVDGREVPLTNQVANATPVVPPNSGIGTVPAGTRAPAYANGYTADMWNGSHLYRFNTKTGRNDTVSIDKLTQAEVLQLMARPINQRLLSPSYYYANGHIYKR
jgi:hypothetical protein